MSGTKHNPNYTEDDFDLEYLKEEHTRQAQLKNMREKNKLIVSRLSLIIALIAFIAAYFLYGFATRRIEEWQTRPGADQTVRVTLETGPTPSSFIAEDKSEFISFSSS